MGQKMAPGTGLNLRQKQFLAVALRQKWFLKDFYLSGGTALASWYLHHRESYDLDFFSDRPFSADRISSWIKKEQPALKYRAITVDDDWGFYTFFLRFPDTSRFKVDFSHYSFTRLKKGLNWKGLAIDSLYDIAVNKTHTIRTQPRERDYVDFYFIVKETGWKIDQLLADADKKFGMTTDTLEVTKHFLRAAEITEYPKMLVPFNQRSMEKFFLNLAKSLKKEIFKK